MATCTQCGAELKPGTKFCENCGAKVSVPQPTAQPAAVPQPPVQPTQAAPQPPQPVQTPPQPQAGGGNPYAGSTPAAPQPQTNAANPYAGNTPGTPPQPATTVTRAKRTCTRKIPSIWPAAAAPPSIARSIWAGPRCTAPTATPCAASRTSRLRCRASCWPDTHIKYDKRGHPDRCIV